MVGASHRVHLCRCLSSYQTLSFTCYLYFAAWKVLRRDFSCHQDPRTLESAIAVIEVTMVVASAVIAVGTAYSACARNQWKVLS